MFGTSAMSPDANPKRRYGFKEVSSFTFRTGSFFKIFPYVLLIPTNEITIGDKVALYVFFSLSADCVVLLANIVFFRDSFIFFDGPPPLPPIPGEYAVPQNTYRVSREKLTSVFSGIFVFGFFLSEALIG